MPGFENFPRVNTLEAAYRAVRAIPSSMHEHMDAIRDAAASAQNILELGLNQGTSCVALLAGLPPGGQMVSVDLQGPLTPIRFVLEWCAGEIRARGWMFLQADSRDALRRLRDMGMTFDLVFLDSSHEYAATKEELDWIATVIRPGGKILCHDTQSFPDVFRALTEFCEARGWDWENRANCHGLGTIFVPAAPEKS